MRKLLRTFAVLIVAVAGCGAPQRPAEESRLPFSVRVRFEARPPSEGESSRGGIPARFEDTRRLTEDLAEALHESRLFTSVLTAEDEGVAADLDLLVAASGSDFGEGKAHLWRSFLSTVVWLLAGHLSWFIDNRTYPESKVILNVQVQPAQEEEGGRGGGNGGAREAIHRDTLPLNALTLNFLDRAGVTGGLLNILVPPVWGDGDPAAAGASLTERSLEFLAQREPEVIRHAIVENHLRALKTFVVHDPEEDRVVVICQTDLSGIVITPDEGDPRALGPVEVGAAWVVDERERQDLRPWLAGRLVGNWDQALNRYYQVDLRPEETGFIRVEAFPAGGGSPGRFTIYRPYRPPQASTTSRS